MHHIGRWLRQEPKTFLSVGGFLSGIFLIDALWNVLYPMGWVMSIIDAWGGPTLPELRLDDSFIRLPDWMKGFYYFLLAPTLEEIVYRLIPLAVVVRVMPWTGWLGVIAIAMESSIFFGLRHHVMGWEVVPLMCGSGLLYSLAFLKCGGMGRKIWKPYLSCLGLHVLYNTTVFYWGYPLVAFLAWIGLRN